MAAVLTVSQLNSYISSKIKFDGKLRGIAVNGEITNLSVNYKSGHMYFSLKDNASSLRCVMFASNASRLRFRADNGMSVMAMGNVDVYERDGIYQLVVTDIIPSGAGAAFVALEQLKEKLRAMGVFDVSAKRKIPSVPKKLAIVTSLDAAALQDILKILNRRYPLVQVCIVPTLVQGAQAPLSIANALKKADSIGADTIIVARGGGSAEDLFAFNTEAVAMAVYNCKTPVVSAVGHETDTSLCDMAADLRAPTPSAAAELCVPDISIIKQNIDVLQNKLERVLENKLIAMQSRLDNSYVRLLSLSPADSLHRKQQAVEKLSSRLETAISAKLEKSEKLAAVQTAKLSALSPLNVLSRGYSVTLNSSGKVVMKSDDVKTGDNIKIMLSQGEITACVKQKG